ncbi:hypothetical protein E4U23_008295 [Claviceps purpurea]|nr:hypothetical protein E4U23_008295 [Claviceps purpurea]
MSAIDSLDEQSKAQIEAFIQRVVGYAAGPPAADLADPVQKRLTHYFESGERQNWSATDCIAYLDTLYADCTTVGEARLELPSCGSEPENHSPNSWSLSPNWRRRTG